MYIIRCSAHPEKMLRSDKKLQISILSTTEESLKRRIYRLNDKLSPGAQSDQDTRTHPRTTASIARGERKEVENGQATESAIWLKRNRRFRPSLILLGRVSTHGRNIYFIFDSVINPFSNPRKKYFYLSFFYPQARRSARGGEWSIRLTCSKNSRCSSSKNFA